MKAVAVAGGSPETPETEGTEVPVADPGTQDTPPGAGGPDTPEPAEAETPAGVEAEAGATETEPEEDAPAAPAAKPEAHPKPKAPTKPDADAEPKPEAGAEPEADAGPEAGAVPGADVEPESAAELDADVDPEADVEPEAEAELEADAGPEAGADAEAEPEAGAEPDAEAGPEAGAEPEADVEPEAGAEPEADVEPEAGAEADADAGSEAGAEPEAGAEAEGGSEAEPEAGETAPEAEARPDTEAEPDAEVGDGVVPGPETEAGDGGVGAGGQDEGAPDEDDAGREARPVPSWARDGEADAERTSQFVALKDLDAPAEKAPWPQAVPQNRTPAPAPARTPAPAPARTPATAPASAPAPATAPVDFVEPTREVPLPPQPPLDLLAELTNTAPAPETPRRTAVRRVKIWTPILLLLAGAATGAQLLRPLPAPQLVAAEQAHTLDGQFSVPWPAKGQGAVRVPGSGDIGTFGEQKPVPTASVAKVMTAYVVLKGHPLRKGESGAQIEVDEKTVADGTSDHESRIEGLVAGTKFSQQDMLKMLMIPSGNNVARLLARWDSGSDSEAAFVAKMNAAAKELGMENTTYTDPSGLDAATVSTAADQLKLAEAVMKDEAFRAVVALPSAEIKGLSKTLDNNNSLLSANGLSIRGIKTGSSTPAGGTLMWAAYKSVGDETPLILGTLMDQHVDGPDPDGANSLKLVLANSKKIIEAVRQALDSAPVVRKGQTVGHVDDGLGGRTPVVATKDLNVIGVPGQQLKLTLRPGASKVPHAAKAGTEVGVLTAGDGEGAKSVPVAVGTDLAEPSFAARVTRRL
ncbi:serine hydrolase [Streptomyces sp. NPDC058290]|uniref:D-alanyl-D-alanine carboxypeptidase n=1 Tax=Streptomyces sp. NPDC058290 TaxID=3346426 RepID=UPI0036E691CB